MACVFPFEYDGKNYTQCTDVDWDQLWCPTVVDAEGKYIDGDIDVTFGNCGNCTSDQDSCKTEDDVACVFPFEYTQYPIIRNGDKRRALEFLKNYQFPDADRFLILQG